MNILHIDDHQLFSDALALGLSSYFEKMNYCHCKSTQEALLLLDDNSFDLILLDFFLGNDKGTALIYERNTKYQSIPILVVSSNRDIWHIKNLMEMGVDGYIFKDGGLEQLCDAIKHVITGKNYFPDEINLKITSLGEGDSACVFDKLRHEFGLSKKQIEVLKLVYDGYSNEMIANLLSRSLNTVKSHVYRSFNLLGVDNRMEFILLVNKKK